MSVNRIVSDLDKAASTMSHSLVEGKDSFVLTINDKEVRFLIDSDETALASDQWLRMRHADGAIHEPGLVAWLVLLSGTVGDRAVIFYDVGSLFGYFAYVAKSLFARSRVVAVEGNPISAGYIERNGAALADFTVLNAVMGTARSEGYYQIKGFQFMPVSRQQHLLLNTRLRVKNGIKAALNKLGGHYRLRRGLVRQLSTVTLPDILQDRAGDALEIMKIDTEGHQATFLPPFVDQLCDRDVVVLMELDSPKKMRSFGTSNNEMIKPFLDRGYAAIWMDHRTGKKAQAIETVTSKFDRNALIALLPRSFVEAYKSV